MLIDLLKNDLSINKFFCNFCAENNISVKIDEAIEKNDILIIRVDNYYNQIVKNPDCSPDCLIIQRCGNSIYNIFIIELRNIISPDGFKISDIVEKFITCLDDFMSNRFANYFHNSTFVFKNIFLLFITDPYGFKDSPNKQIKMQGHKLDTLISQKIPKYFGKHLYISHKIPDPTIKKCL